MIYLSDHTNMVNVDLRSILSIYTIEGYKPDDTVCNDGKNNSVLELLIWVFWLSVVLDEEI